MRRRLLLALTTAADLPDRVRRVVAVNAYDHRGGIRRSSPLARLIITGVIAPGVVPLSPGWNPSPSCAILTGGLADPAALGEDYLDELLKVGRLTHAATAGPTRQNRRQPASCL